MIFKNIKHIISLIILQTLPLSGGVGGGLWVSGGLRAQNFTFTSPSLQTDSLQFKVEALQDGLYNVYAQSEQSQLMMPLYRPSGEGTIDIRMQEGCPMIEVDNDNKALSAFNLETYRRSRSYWMGGENWTAEQIKAHLKSYAHAVDSIKTLYSPAEPVAQYLDIWAYVQAFNEFDAMPNATKKKPADVGIELTDILARPEEALNKPMAQHFSLASYAIFRTLPKGTYDERVAYLNANYTDEKLRAQVDAMLEKRKEAAVGMPFPDNVTLVDADGNAVDFAQFRGKYVYIDLWASWCGPCIKEVPHLQELEKTLDNPDLVFVSISLDTTDKPWKAKMQQLNMHGNQYLNADGSLANALHVTGIPRFVIYDKEGRLYMGNAPRPSHESIKLLLGELH